MKNICFGLGALTIFLTSIGINSYAGDLCIGPQSGKDSDPATQNTVSIRSILPSLASPSDENTHALRTLTDRCNRLRRTSDANRQSANQNNRAENFSDISCNHEWHQCLRLAGAQDLAASKTKWPKELHENFEGTKRFFLTGRYLDEKEPVAIPIRLADGRRFTLHISNVYRSSGESSSSRPVITSIQADCGNNRPREQIFVTPEGNKNKSCGRDISFRQFDCESSGIDPEAMILRFSVREMNAESGENSTVKTYNILLDSVCKNR